jgi:ABC-type branched-subunit amino acid transport system permease subunit
MKTGVSLQVLFLMVAGVALLALPNFVDNYVIYIGARLFVYVLVALGLNLLTGYAGQVSLGHAAFFAISALYTGLAGALSAFLVGFLDPQEFSVFLSIQFITIIILEGLASLLGSVLGAGFLIILPELLAGLDVWQAFIYGVIMVLTILFMPFGLSGAIRRYAYRWFGIGVEPIIPRRLGH